MKNASAQHALARLPTSADVSSGRATLIVGTDNGARHNLDAYVQVHRELPKEFDEFIFADALGSRAERFAADARERGLPARGLALTTRDLGRRADLHGRIGLVIGHLDRAGAQREALNYAVAERVPALLYFLLAPPRALPLGFAVALTPDDYDTPALADVRMLLDTIAPLTSRRGSASIIDSSPESSLRDRDIRMRFREHAPSVMTKLAAGLQPDVDVIQATTGVDTWPTLVLPSDRWAEPDELEERVLLGRRDRLIEPGSRMLVVETLTGSEPELRLHDAVFRRRDRRLSDRSSRTITREDFEPREIVSGGASTNTSTGTGTGGAGSVLALLALFAIVLGAASRRAPVGTTD